MRRDGAGRDPTQSRTSIRVDAGLPTKRRLAGALLGAGTLTALTVALLAVHTHLGLPSILLLYLTAIVAIALIGGTWPAIASAVVASAVINWFFTPPTHTWTIADPENVLALVVFLLVAGVVSVL